MRGGIVVSAAALALASVIPAAADAHGHGHHRGHGGHGHHGHHGHGHPVDPTKALTKAVTVDGIMEHESALQGFADGSGGTRTMTSAGFNNSVDYVYKRLKKAGYVTTKVPFDFPDFNESAPSQLSIVGGKTFVNPADFMTTEFSGGTNGPIEAKVVPTNDIVEPPSAEPSSTSGCEASDFPPETAGNIALVQRGTCFFVDKIANAKAAGAVAIIIYNEGQEGRTEALEFSGIPYDSLPVLSASYQTGKDLIAAAAAGQTVHMQIDATTTHTTQYNVIADTPTGDPNQTVVVGSHLDSVDAGPGINDNGSGSSQDLEIAEQVAKLHLKPARRIRFAFWAAEEEGLLGSTAYVNGLSPEAQKQIALNLNFDMVASPNFVRFVYDGDDTETAPPGSAGIKKAFADAFASKGLAWEPTPFDGRSDYGPFIAVGIPAGGLFSGAEEIKTPEEAATYGGTAGVAYDSCYHQACDTINNLNRTALDQFSDASATVLWQYASSTTPLAKRAAKPKVLAKPVATNLAFAGPFATR